MTLKPRAKLVVPAKTSAASQSIDMYRSITCKNVAKTTAPLLSLVDFCMCLVM